MTVAPSNDAVRPLRRSVWPYAGLVAAATGLGWTVFLSHDQGVFADDGHAVTTAFMLDHLTSSASMRIGGGLAVAGVVSALVFLVGLTRWLDDRVTGHEGWRAALRWTSTAFVASASVGAVLHHVAAGGARDGIDRAMYTPEASTTIAVLADQLSYAASLPSLAVMAIVGVLAVRTRVLPRTVGVVGLLLAAASGGATLALGLPYSSALVWPVFALVTAVALLLRRRTV